MIRAESARSSGRDEPGEVALTSHLEYTYDIKVVAVGRLDAAVFRIDRQDGPAWVARVFPPRRPIEKARGDAEILRFLQTQGFPAERCAHPSAVSTLADRAVLVTDLIVGVEASPNAETLVAFGELIGRLNSLPAESGAVARDAGSLHHWTKREGRPGNELLAAVTWLTAIQDRVPDGSRPQYESLMAQLTAADDCSGLPDALIHPDPVLKNTIVIEDGSQVVIDWAGAGRGPRLASVAVMLWSNALSKGGWSPRRVDAVVAGYRLHGQLQEDELARLASVMRNRPLIFASSRFRHAIVAGEAPDGTEWWWPCDDLTEAIAQRARAAFAGTPEG
jgi:Ser/Thr protein kinase RdoA (MazF antagonist)